MIQFNNVTKRYNNHIALDNVNFTLNTGEMAFLTGHSGAGKSTLLKLIMMMEEVDNGEISVNGNKLRRLRKKHIPQLRRNIGMIFQNPHLLEDRSVFDNVALPLIIAGFQHQEIGRRVRAALDKVGLLDKEHLLPSLLSTGEQQRVGIARAVVNKPSIILADEPTGNLDPALSAEIMNLFEQFNNVGVSVLIASHDLSLIARLSHRIITLRKGALSG